MNSEFLSKRGRKRTAKDGDKCAICGDKAVGLNFSVLTCAPCKAFFRRNAVKLGNYEFQCRNDGDCPMTSGTRRQCNCCRLAKCFRLGMKRNAIRTAEQRRERRRLIERNRQKRVEKNKTSPIVDEQLMVRSSRLSRYSDANSPLSLDDHGILTNIHDAYERTCVPFTYREQLSMPVNETLTLEKFLNASAKIYLGLINYFKSLPEFNRLSVDNKLSLIKGNLNQIFRIHSTFIIKTITPDLDKDSPVCLYIFPEDLYLELRATAMALTTFVYDPMLIKLFIIVLMLSTHMNVQYEKIQTETVDENAARDIFNAQNIYTDLLWRYILSRCPSYRQSVQLFTSLISRTLYSQIVQVKVNDFVYFALRNRRQSLEPIIKAIWT